MTDFDDAGKDQESVNTQGEYESIHKWEDVHLKVCKDDLYKGPGHRCISYKGVIYKSENNDQPVEKRIFGITQGYNQGNIPSSNFLLNDCRRVFEEWCNSHWLEISTEKDKIDSNIYRSEKTIYAWESWKAAHAAYNNTPKRELSAQELLAKKIVDWVASLEGKKSLEETAQGIREMLETLKEQRRLDPEELRKPMTI